MIIALEGLGTLSKCCIIRKDGRCRVGTVRNTPQDPRVRGTRDRVVIPFGSFTPTSCLCRSCAGDRVVEPHGTMVGVCVGW